MLTALLAKLTQEAHPPAALLKALFTACNRSVLLRDKVTAQLYAYTMETPALLRKLMPFCLTERARPGLV